MFQLLRGHPQGVLTCFMRSVQQDECPDVNIRLKSSVVYADYCHITHTMLLLNLLKPTGYVMYLQV
jgi:hypothetical protein